MRIDKESSYKDKRKKKSIKRKIETKRMKNVRVGHWVKRLEGIKECRKRLGWKQRSKESPKKVEIQKEKESKLERDS